MRVNIVDKMDRNVLGEGRSMQMGFAFCKKISEDSYETVHPISPCKDYLSDVVWTEHTGKHISCCGLTYNKRDIYDGKTAYMAIKICKSKYGSTYPDYEKDRENLSKNYKNIQTILNWVEDQLKIEQKTEILQTSKDDIFFLKFDYFWSQYPYLTSLYALLVRIAQWYRGEKHPGKFLEEFCHGADMYLWKTAGPRLSYLIECGATNVPKQAMTENHAEGGHPHSSGIYGFLKPFTQIKQEIKLVKVET